MGRLIATLVVLAALVIGLGFYLNWFSIAKTEDKAGGGVDYNVHIDTGKMKADTKKAEDKAKEAGSKIKEEIQEHKPKKD
jgi:hypothetical protein